MKPDHSEIIIYQTEDGGTKIVKEYLTVQNEGGREVARMVDVSSNPMTNASLRVRFGIEGKNSSIISRTIKEAVEAKLVRPYDTEQGRKYAKYLPFWA